MGPRSISKKRFLRRYRHQTRLFDGGERFSTGEHFTDRLVVRGGFDMVKVMVPATSANLGPGFDFLGLALDLYNTVSLHPPMRGT